MNLPELHAKLLDAYSGQNLNKISVTLISLYKEQQFGTLRQIAEMVSESLDITIDPEAKYFSKLMMLYHPDRGDFHRNEINRRAAANDQDGLLEYAHILLLGRIEEIAATMASYEDIDYSPVYEWDINLDGFTIVTDKDCADQEKKNNRAKSSGGYTFYDAVKIRMFGKTTVGFPPHYLEDLDEFELAQSDIDDLDGVQYCIHAVAMDLSGNTIQDISPLWGLTLLEELNISDNRIKDIDALANLRNLRTIDLSNNSIKDISPLTGLNKLEFIDLTGSRILPEQVRELEEMGITVVY